MKKSIKFSVFLFSILITGCFLDKDEGSTTKKTQSGDADSVVGLLSLENDLSSSSLVYGKFYGVSAKNQKISKTAFLLAKQRKESVSACQLEVESLEASYEAISAGKVNLLFPDGKTEIEIKEGSDSQTKEPYYSYQSKEFMGAGTYQFKVQGSNKAPSFSISVVMPEIFSFVNLNGTDIFNNEISVSLNKNLKIEWQAPKVVDEKNLILFSITSQTDKNYTLYCQIEEESVYRVNEESLSWEIPKEDLSKLPKSDLAMVSFLRGQAFRANNQTQTLTITAQALNSISQYAVVTD